MKYKIISIITILVILINSIFTLNVMALKLPTIKGEYQFTSNELSNKQLKDSFEYSDQCFMNSSFNICSKLETLSAQVAISSASWFGDKEDKYEIDYSNNAHNVIDFLTKMEFKNVSTNKYYTLEKLENSAAVAVGYKTITTKDKNYTLLAIIPRSALYKQEWAGNFDVGNTGIHKGFKAGRDEILRFVKKYIQDNHIEGNLKVWIAGHSRGAALSNMLGAFFAGGGIDYFGSTVQITPEDVYCYTYATPTTITLGTEKNIELSVEGYRGGEYQNDTNEDAYTYTKGGTVNPQDEVYQGIHNFISPYDFIAQLPLYTWKYTRYGIDVSFDHNGQVKEEDMLKELKEISPFAYNKYINYSGPSLFEEKTIDRNTLKIIKSNDLNLSDFVRKKIAGLAHKASNVEIYNNQKYQDGLVAAAGIYGMALVFFDEIDFEKNEQTKEDLIYSLLFSYLSYASDILKEENRAETDNEALAVVLEELVTYFTKKEVTNNTTLDQLLEILLKYSFETENEVLIDELVQLLLQVIPSDYQDTIIEFMKEYHKDYDSDSETEISKEEFLKNYLRACAYGTDEESIAYQTRKTAKDARGELYQALSLVLLFARPNDGFKIANTLLMDESGECNASGTVKDLVDVIAPIIMTIKGEEEGEDDIVFNNFQEAADYRLKSLVDNLSEKMLNDSEEKFGEDFKNDLLKHVNNAKKNITEIREAFTYFFLYDGKYSIEKDIKNILTFISNPEAIALAHYNEVYIAYAKANEKYSYTILEGDNQTFTQEKSNDLVIKTSGDFNKFIGLKVDGIEINNDNYKVKSGSTIVTLKKSYLETLEDGEHTISFLYNDGSVDATFIVSNDRSPIINPETKDNILNYIIMLCISSIGLLGLLLYTKRKKQL